MIISFIYNKLMLQNISELLQQQDIHNNLTFKTYLCLSLNRTTLLSVIHKYLNIIKQNIVLMRHGTCTNLSPYAVAITTFFHLIPTFEFWKSPLQQSVIQNWKMQDCLPFTDSKHLVTALESEYLDNSIWIQPFAQPLL